MLPLGPENALDAACHGAFEDFPSGCTVLHRTVTTPTPPLSSLENGTEGVPIDPADPSPSGRLLPDSGNTAPRRTLSAFDSSHPRSTSLHLRFHDGDLHAQEHPAPRCCGTAGSGRGGRRRHGPGARRSGG
ncbi:hypothetical protein ACFFX0_13085 [Citricoccus parietis]|uniref:Uncharacterized protein n=1 Tax=Citricoccus parietis TaxID=592307 RepID=A0ABV5FZH7_9MICC